MAEMNKSAEPTTQQAQPGQVIAPGAAQTSVPQPATPQPPAAPQAQAPNGPAPQANSAPQEPVPASHTQADGNGISWTASEFIAHEKSAGWYGGLLVVALVLAGFVYLLTRDIISTTVVLVGAGALAALAARKPKQQQYYLDDAGFSIGQKHYAYEMFRSFSVVPEGAFSSIVFMPLKRFAQTATIYYAPDDEDKIINILSERLPFEEHRADAVDSLMRRIRF